MQVSYLLSLALKERGHDADLAQRAPPRSQVRFALPQVGTRKQRREYYYDKAEELNGTNNKRPAESRHV